MGSKILVNSSQFTKFTNFPLACMYAWYHTYIYYYTYYTLAVLIYCIGIILKCTTFILSKEDEFFIWTIALAFPSSLLNSALNVLCTNIFIKNSASLLNHHYSLKNLILVLYVPLRTSSFVRIVRHKLKFYLLQVTHRWNSLLSQFANLSLDSYC